jgi:dynein heavy chain
VKKVVQLYDSKNTRHGNMLVGTSMSGKSTCWKILKNTLNTLSKVNSKYPQVKYEVLNPKAVDLKELFGFMDMNGEWHEGVLSSMMSRLCKEESEAQRWMVLDGPVDTLWIESMNTVLDDNKVLTLLNGDRINLPPQVGLIFEVEDLAVASPATVSRAGMVYLNLNDLGWRPYFQSWLISKIK